MRYMLRLAPIVVIALPAVAAAAAPNTLKDLVATIVDLLNTATGVLVAAALVAFLYGAAYNVLKAGEQGSGALRQFLVWGVIILFVMVSIWGILNLLQQTLFGNSGGASSGASGSLNSSAAPVESGGGSGNSSNIRFE